MAATNFQFNAVLRFSGRQAEAGMARVNTRFRAMNQAAQRTSAAISRAGQASRALSFALAPVALATGNAVITAANYEQQLSIVQSVLLTTKDKMEPLEKITKKLGATTEFTAFQAAQGAEQLSRAGFSMEETVSALPGVLNAASASGTDLATTTRIVASSIRAFNRPAKEAILVADEMTLVTARTNTTFLELGEAMKLASPITAQLGFTSSETAAAIGLIANTGVRGTRAGTALANALQKLIDPSKETKNLFGGKEGINQLLKGTADASADLLPLPVIFTNVAKAIATMAEGTDRAAFATEVFGKRGVRGFAAFDAQAQRSIPITTKNVEALRKGIKILGRDIKVSIGGTIPFITALELEAAGAEGTSAKMSKIRLDNLKGQFIILKSAVEGLNIEVGDVFNESLKGITQTTRQFISVMVRGFQLAKQKGPILLGQEIEDLGTNKFAPLLEDMISFAQGFIEGFQEIKQAAKETFAILKEAIAPFFSESSLTVKEIGKLVAKVLILGTIAAPILAGIGLALFILPPILGTIFGFFGLIVSTITFLGGIALPILGGIFTAIGLILSPIGLVITSVLLLIDVFQALVRPGKFLDNMFSVQLKRSVVGFFEDAFDSASAFISKFKVLKNLGGALKKFFTFGDDDEVTTTAKTFEVKKSSKLVSDIRELSKPKIRSPLEPSMSDASKAVEGKKIQAEMIKSKALVTPPSTNAIVSSIRNQFRSEKTTGGGGGKSIKLTGVLESRIDGRDLLIAITNAKIDQQTAEGRSPDPRVEGRQRRNGSSF